MSGIEVLTNFFENIRPRYSWSSSETVATDSNEVTTSVSTGNDGEHSDWTLASPPTSPMSDVEPTVDDCGVYTDTEAEDMDDEDEGDSVYAHSADGSIIAALTNDDLSSNRLMPRSIASSIVSTSQPIVPPSEGPSNMSATTEPSVHVQNTLPDISSAAQAADITTRNNETSAPHVSLLIPEDDGHRLLREKVMAIQRSGLPEKERAQKMHILMTEKYTTQSSSIRSILPSAERPRSLQLDGNHPIVSQEDKEPSYADEEAEILGCQHYRRNVKLQCSTCDKWYPCRFCHDEKEDHLLVRRETKNMLCMHCGKAQPASQFCKQCGRYAAHYYCDKCKLWDDDPQKTIYHCNDCGICRIGIGLGKDFFHCKKCGVCMSIELEGSHRCIERSTDCDCPICGEYLFTSIMTVVFMGCGHSIHLDCYNEHMKTSYRCPTCAKSILNMESRFRYLDYEIARQPLPDPYKDWHCHIICNDCSAKGDVPFHFLGLKCDTCMSYNTCEVKLIRPEDETGTVNPSTLPRNRLPPRHLMPNPETAGGVGGEEVVTDLASVLREIEGRESGTAIAEQETTGSDDVDEGSECSCGRSHHHDSDSMDDDEDYEENEDENFSDHDGVDDDTEGQASNYNSIYLPYHP